MPTIMLTEIFVLVKDLSFNSEVRDLTAPLATPSPSLAWIPAPQSPFSAMVAPRYLNVYTYSSSLPWLSFSFFTALHGMQTRSCDEISVCPSVCLSVCQTRASWQKGRKFCPDFYTMRKIILSSLMRRRMVGGGRPLLSEIWVNQPALEWTRRFWTNNRS